MEQKKWKILLPATIDSVGPESISDIATFTKRSDYEGIDDLQRDINKYDGIITRTESLPGELIAAADSLKIISKHGTGVDNIDIAAATKKGVIVANTPGANTTSVAEHAITLLLAVKRNIVKANEDIRNGNWQTHEFRGSELSNRTLGLFGAGNAGRKLVQLLTGFDISFVAYDPYVESEDINEKVNMVKSVERLFELADDVSIHAPLTKETKHAISCKVLTKLSDDGIVVNTARGGIVDERALATAIERGDIAGAGIDVYESEPPKNDNPLLGTNNVILTQHNAGVTVEALQQMSRKSAANIRTVYNGNVPGNALNESELS